MMKWYFPIVLILFPLWVSSQCTSFAYQSVADESWISCSTSDHPALMEAAHWVEVDMIQVRGVGEVHIWNFNVADSTGLGFREIEIYHSLDSIDWHLLGRDTLAEASGVMADEGQASLNFNGQSARYILIAAVNNYGAPCFGLSEVRIDFNECRLPTANINFVGDLCRQKVTTFVEVVPQGGNDPYQFIWSTGDTTAQLYNLQSGSYAVTVIDSLGCNMTAAFGLDYRLTYGDTILLDQDSIPGGIYYGLEALYASGTGRSGSSLELLFANRFEFTPTFEAEPGTTIGVAYVDCMNDTTTTTVIDGFEVERIPTEFYKNYIGYGHFNLVDVSVSSEDEGYLGDGVLTGLGALDGKAASRFLAQATLGFDEEMVSEVSELDFEAWLDWQFCIPHANYGAHLQNISRFSNPDINYWLNYHRAWWHRILTGKEYLRDRIALALSEIFVVSSKSFLLNYADGLTSYYDMLSRNAFGNFKTLLYDVTMHPVMGFYLSHINNPRSDTTINQFPDENYAREVLQLFSIGLYELNSDGTYIFDGQGQRIPTYDNSDIVEFAKVFTGLGFCNYPFGTAGNSALVGLPYTQPMCMSEADHEPGPKTLLNGYLIPGGQSAMEDIEAAIEHISNHPNVAPFISLRLIQQLVKSEPSPDYISRIAAVFNDDGDGIRGNLQAVVKAILLDPEARDCSWIAIPEHGKLKEPFARFVHLLKAFELSSTANTFYALGENVERLTLQAPLRAPSVFNFFEPGFMAPGILSDSMIRSPEFQIYDSYSSIGYVNLIDSLSAQSHLLDVEEGTVSLDLSDELLLAGDVPALVDHLNHKLTYGSLSPGSRDIIIDAVKSLAMPHERVRMAIYLIAVSPDYTILR